MFLAYYYLLLDIKFNFVGKAHFTMKLQKQNSQFLIQIYFFYVFENNIFEPIRFPQQVPAYFYLLIPQFDPFEKITN
jgi:hypothetical protein